MGITIQSPIKQNENGVMALRRFWRNFICSMIISLIMGSVALAAETDTVLLKLDNDKAMVDGVPYRLQASPRVIEGSTMVPLRFLVEIFGARTHWESETKEITVQSNGNVIRLHAGGAKAVVNDVKIPVPAAPVIENGVTLVPLRFLAENLDHKVTFSPQRKEIFIEQSPPLPPSNKKPVAEFDVVTDTVAQGETVIYKDKSYDPDGDKLVERKWTGNKRAFFEPGEHEVTLSVKDSRGAWSETYTKVIKVTSEVKMDKFEYSLHNPVPGEPLDISHIPVLSLKQVDPAVNMNRESVMISNSPEIIRENGILYSDMLEGEHRLYYHHINGSKETKKVYLLAINQGKKPVRLTVQKSGTAGPADPMAVGRAAAYRFLDYIPGESRFLELKPGEKVVINEGLSDTVTPGNTVNGIFNINAHDELKFMVVAVNDRQALENISALSVLPRDDNHIRGTFSRGNRFLSVYLTGNEPARLVVADGQDDSFLYGKDEKLVSKNKGNYGLIYRIRITAQNRVGVLFSPRGGVFAGAGEWDRKAFYLPNKGVLQPKEGAMIGVIEPGQEKVLEFIPPAGSYLPVNLIFIPF